MRTSHTARALLFFALLLAPLTASAAEDDGTSIWGGVAGTICSTSLALTTTVGLPIYTLNNPEITSNTTSQAAKKTYRGQLHRYLNNNAHALIMDLAAGGGPALRDLARLRGLREADLPALASAMRQHRAAFTPLLLRPEITPAITRTFDRRLQHIIDAHLRT